MIEYKAFRHPGRADNLITAGWYAGQYVDGEQLCYIAVRHETEVGAQKAAEEWRKKDEELAQCI